jgi:hypothetical protein
MGQSSCREPDSRASQMGAQSIQTRRLDPVARFTPRTAMPDVVWRPTMSIAPGAGPVAAREALSVRILDPKRLSSC